MKLALCFLKKEKPQAAGKTLTDTMLSPSIMLMS